MAVGRIAGEAGYLDNYYRYFGVPQDPFGWHYHYLSAWMEISTATPWLRVLPFMFAMASWWLISRAAIPRLGRAVRESTPAIWAAALVFLAVWMPYNNGLRVEPLIALGTIFTWVCVERAIATGRFFPLTIGIISAAFTLTIHHTGVIASIALIAGIRPLIKRLAVRRKRDGLWPLLLPILAAGLAVMFEIFADQPLAPILEAVSVNGQVGPTNKWWEEPMRYYMLMNPTADGGIARRFGILIVFTCFVLVVVMLLNRRRLPGIATAPTWRLVAMVAGSAVLMAFLPTKWTHQLGVYAAIGGALHLGHRRGDLGSQIRDRGEIEALICLDADFARAGDGASGRYVDAVRAGQFDDRRADADGAAAIALGMWNTIAGSIFTVGGEYNYREGVSVWYRSFLAFQPDASLMAQAPIGFKLHALVAFILFAMWPFTRLVHVFSAPIQYLWRPYVVYRSRDPKAKLGTRAPARAWERPELKK